MPDATARKVRGRRKADRAGRGRLSGTATSASAGKPGAAAQYMRWRLVTSREVRRAWRFTAAAALRLRSCVGFS